MVAAPMIPADFARWDGFAGGGLGDSGVDGWADI